MMNFYLVLSVFACAYAGSEDTYTLQKWEYCAGCKITVEHFFRQSSESIRQSQADKGRSTVEAPMVFDLEPIVSNICMDEHFYNFVPEMTYACVKLIDSHKDVFLKYNEFDHVDDQKTAVMPTKSNFYKASKEICLDTAKACPKYMYPKKPISQKDRTFCKACAATGECMEVMKAVTVRQNNHEVVENVCESLGFSHQPSGWIEDYCEEIVEDNEGAMVDILNHYDFDNRVSVTTELCENLLGCSDGARGDL